MKYKELQQMRINAYKNFIKMRYGEEALNDLETAVKSEATNKILEIRDEAEFIDAITELRESKKKCDECK